MLARFDHLGSMLARHPLPAALAVGLWLGAAPANAHIELLTPAARYTPDYQKSEPCGHPDNPPGRGPVATYQAGETITIELDEFVNHSGHLRVALDPTGTDDFVSPMGFEDFYNSPQVLLDNIVDMQNGGLHTIDVTLPDEPCDPCTLQVIQVMNDGSWGPGVSDLYFQCADIVIEGSAAETGGATTSGGDETGPEPSDSSGGGGETGTNPGTDGPSGSEGPGEGSTSVAGGTGGGTNPGTDTTGPADESDDGGGCSCRTDQGSSGAAPWLLAALLLWRRRRLAGR